MVRNLKQHIKQGKKCVKSTPNKTLIKIAKITLKCQSTSVVNIFLSVSSSKESIPKMFIWRMNRLLTSLRPHPGGLKAQTRRTSKSSSLEVSFLSYQWPWSTHWKKSILLWRKKKSQLHILLHPYVPFVILSFAINNDQTFNGKKLELEKTCFRVFRLLLHKKMISVTTQMLWWPNTSFSGSQFMRDKFRAFFF